MTKRLNVRISDEVAEKVRLWSERFGITQSQLGGMALQSGLDTIIRAVDPVESLSPVQLEKIIQAAARAGVDLKETSEG